MFAHKFELLDGHKNSISAILYLHYPYIDDAQADTPHYKHNITLMSL